MLKNQIRVLSVIIGTMIGAGFASGKELFLFFGQYGPIGFLGVTLSTFLTSFIIYRTFLLLHENAITNYEDFLQYILGKLTHFPFLFSIIKNIVSLFLLVSFFVMIAGFGAYFAQELSLAPMVGILFLALFCFYIFSHDVSYFIKANTFLIPFFIAFVLFLGIENFPFATEIIKYLSFSSSGHWLLDAILYSSYNSILLIPILVTLSPFLTKKQHIRNVAIGAFGIFLLLSIILLLLLYRISGSVSLLEIPILYSVSDFGSAQVMFYGIMILIAILTSAISAGYSFLQNISVKRKESKKKIAFCICFFSLFVSSFGFSHLMELLYPIFGYLGILQICPILLKKRRKTDIK